MKTIRATDQVVHHLFTDGAGMGPDGAGSGYAWIDQTSGNQRVKRRDGLTNNEAEYRAVLYAVLNLPRRARARIYSDSQLIVNQFNGLWAVNDPELARLLGKIRGVIRDRELRVKLIWIPREENPAGRLL